MKVLILQNIVSNNNVHTINTLMERLHLSSNDVVVYFCSETESNRQWKLQETARFSYHVLPNSALKLRGKDLFTYFINPGIVSVLQKEDPDWIIVGGWDQFAYQIALLWGWWNRKRVTLWSGSTVYEKSWRRTVSLPLVRLLVRLSSDFIAYGTRAKAYLTLLGAPEENSIIHPNDVNRKYFSSQAKKFRPTRELLKKQHGISAKKNFIFVGQLIDRKGIKDLLEAYRLISRKNSDWGLIIIGSGYLREYIQTFKEKNKLDDIKILGNVEQYDLPKYYVCSDCLVLPSHEEVWGLVVNEAIACGLPVIVSDICGCVPDLKKHGELHIFERGNRKDLEQVMVSMMRAHT